jgi:site-specific DNA-cytosine methylase
VEKDPQARQASMQHVMMLQQSYPHLLPTSSIHGYQHSLLSNITLLGTLDLAKSGPIDLVIFGWPCQGLSQAGTNQGLSNPKSSLFWEWIFVVQHLQQSDMHPCAYLLENVPPLGDSRPTILARWQQIRAWIDEPM